VGRFVGNPPNVISSKPFMPVGDFLNGVVMGSDADASGVIAEFVFMR